MKRSLKRIVVGALATGVVAVALPMSSAAAINSTPCGNRTDIVKVTYTGGKTFCMANAGVTNRKFPNMLRVSSGNNEVRFVVDGQTISMGKWQTKRAVDNGQDGNNITRLRIL